MTRDLTRRSLLMAGAALGATLTTPVLANDSALDEILNQNARDSWGGGYDVAVAAESDTAVASTVPVFSERAMQATVTAVNTYRNIVAGGGWPLVPADKTLKLGLDHPNVAVLRKRLMISGDLSTRAGMSNLFDTYVDAAAKRFQARHGLPADGMLGKFSLAALNVPADVRLRQLEINLDRLTQRLSGDARPAGRYVMVNIPGAEIEAVEGGRVAQRHTAIVGRPSRPTPVLESQISELNLNPYWHAPKSIVRKDIIPLMRKDPSYLKDNGIRIYDAAKSEIDPRFVNWQTEEAVNYLFKQDPSRINAMRSAKINFPNKHAVYMHDTPQQGLFDKLVRFESSGCVRVRNIRDLLTWLARDTPGWNRQSLETTIAAGERTDAKLAQPVGVYFTYISAWSVTDGVVQFRDDVYGRDGERELAIGTMG